MNYPKSSPNATSALRKIFAAAGEMRFDRYMEKALYHQEFGYYAQEPTQVGKAGDFFTSVSCGPLFGKIIAERIAAWWREENIQGPWRIIEPGPNNAALAIDILTSLLDEHHDLVSELEYVTIDPMPLPRAFQAKALAQFSKLARCLDRADGLTPLPTFVVANEIIDAFPCRLIQVHNEIWQEVYVASQDDQLHEILRPCDCREIPDCLRDISAFAEGYRTEFRDQVRPFFESLLSVISHGKFLFFDYGFATPEYYHADRRSGTLRVYQNHQASENPLDQPGMMDITAHVDFTDLASIALATNCTVTCFEPQEFFLTRYGASKLEQWAQTPLLLRNFQTLTHPSQLGGKFHAIEFSYQEQSPSHATALRRLALDFS